MQFPELNDLPTVQLYGSLQQSFSNRESFVLFKSVKDTSYKLWINFKSPAKCISGTIEKQCPSFSLTLKYLYNRNRKILVIHELYHNAVTDKYTFRQAVVKNLNLRILKSKSELEYREH